MSMDLLEKLYMGILLTLIVAVIARNFRISVWFYIVHAVLVGSVFVWYANAMNNNMMYIWFSTTFITQVILIPFAPGGLFATIKRYKPKETVPIVPFSLSIVIILVLVTGTWNFFHMILYFIAPTPESMLEPSRSNLAIAFTIFCLGIFTVLTRKDVIKAALGLCILGNSIDLALVDLAPTMPETVILGILTNVIVSVFILLYLCRLMYSKFGVTDTVQLSELRY